jgi:hypothetical protein
MVEYFASEKGYFYKILKNGNKKEYHKINIIKMLSI